MNSEKIYPRTNDHETVYLKSVVKDPNILVGDFTMYNDFVNDPRQFEMTAIPNSIVFFPIFFPHLEPGSLLCPEMYFIQCQI